MKLTIAIFACILSISAFAQTEGVYQTFYETRLINGHTVEMTNEGISKFIISHRFGTVNGGLYNLFGLDNSTIRIGLDYGVTNWLNIGVARNSFEKTYDGFVKARFLQQSTGDKAIPISLVGYSSMAISTLKNPTREVEFSERINYAHQLLIARKFHDRFSLQLMPSLIHRNLVLTNVEKNDVLALGAGFKFKVFKRLSINGEYYYVLPDQLAAQYQNSASLGFAIETKGHIFQIHLSNSRGMIEKFFISETTGVLEDGDIHIGFNITRDFKMKGKKSR